MTALRVGVGWSRGLAPADVVDAIRLAESLGYESAWMAEGHAGDQFAILGAAAAVTSRIRLGTSISSVFVRTASTIAMSAITVDHLSSGRFVLGLGTSHREQVEPEHGVPFVEPTARLRDTVAIVRGLARDGRIAHRGRVVTIESFERWFTPRRREIPIYIAALFPKMLEIVGEIGDGALLTWPTLDAPRRAREHLAAGAKRAGRAPGPVASLIPCAVAKTRREALDALRPAVAFYAGFFPRYNRLLAESGFPDEARTIKAAWDAGEREHLLVRRVPDAMVDAVAIAGTAEECRERLQRYHDAGLDLPIISPRPTGPDARESAMTTLRALAPDR